MKPAPCLPPLESPPVPTSLPDMARRQLLEMTLPEYLVPKEGGGGRCLFYFQVPRRHRPEGWPGARRLPIDEKKRTGLGDIAEWNAAIEDAKKLYAQMQAEKLKQAPVAEPHGTIPWLIARITDPAINEAWASHSEATQTAYRGDFRTIREWSVEIQHRPLASILRSEITAFLGRFRKQPFKQHHVKTALRYLFQQAKADDLVQGSPIDKDMKLAERPKSQPKEWPVEVVEAVCALAVKEGRPSIAKALWTKWGRGLRNTDLLALVCPESVFQEAGVWVIDCETSKTGAAVIVRLPDEAAALHEAELADLMDKGVKIGPRPFLINERTGKAWDMRAWQKNVSDLLAHPAVNRSDLKPGWLRHTMMTHVDEAGVSDAAGAALAGHSPSSHAQMKERHYRIKTRALAEQAVVGLEAHRTARRNKERKSDAGV